MLRCGDIRVVYPGDQLPQRLVFCCPGQAVLLVKQVVDLPELVEKPQRPVAVADAVGRELKGNHPVIG